MKFDLNKYDIEQWIYEIKVTGKMIGMSDEKNLQHLKESFPPEIEAQLLEIEDKDIAMSKTRVLVLLPNQKYHKLLYASTCQNEKMVKYIHLMQSKE